MASSEPEGAGGDRTLLWVVELGGYPNFVELYRSLGYQVETVTSGRKAIASLKRTTPNVVVAEFNVQRDFRDRTSNLESILATLQGRRSNTRVVVLYRASEKERLDSLRRRFPTIEALAYPVTSERLEALLTDA